MDDRARERRLPHVVEMLLWAGWFSAPVWLCGAVLVAAAFFGETPTDEEMRKSQLLLTAGLVCGLALPVVGVVLAGWAGRRRAAWSFGVALALTVAVLGYFLASY